MTNIPSMQSAVQLIGADDLVLNAAKEVAEPGPYQILCRIEAVGLCFSDLKLLKQFSDHVRKGPVVSGIEPGVLDEIPSYVPGESPAVPGHEAVVTVVAVGPRVKKIKVGQRFLVQTDYRWLKTEGSNAALGYNFEGALQEYVLMDQRVITSPRGESMLIPARGELSASAVALVEPWACVENAYASVERRTIKKDGELLIYSDVQLQGRYLLNLLDKRNQPRRVTWASKLEVPGELDQEHKKADGLADLEDEAYDDVVYFGSNAETIEALFAKVANGGLFNIVLGESRLERDVVAPVGRVHYGGIRIIGTTGWDPRESMKSIPAMGELRAGDKVCVVGAGGPMGMMHVVRSICCGVKGVSVFGKDLDRKRLDVLAEIAGPLAVKAGVSFDVFEDVAVAGVDAFDYIVLMAPIPMLVSNAVKQGAANGIINIFAGIPANVSAELDLNTYIERQLYFIGTSGSVLDDMKKVLGQVESGRLDTDVSVAAISGFEGAVDGIKAVEGRSIAGKIIVYPCCKGLGLTPLEELASKLPEVAECLSEGRWCKAAEDSLLNAFAN